MSWTTASTELNDNQTQIRCFDINGLSVRGSHTYINRSQLDTKKILIAPVFSLLFSPIPFSGRVSHIIQFPLDHLHLTLIDHLSPHLSTCPIRHLLGLFVSYGSQCITVQKSSPHKCGQKSSRSAFNTVVATFPYIFLGFFLSHMFMRHVPIIGASWRVVLVTKMDI